MIDPASGQNLCCVVHADVSGAAPLYEKLGETEGKRAVERCVNRIQRVVLGKGQVVNAAGNEVVGVFESAEDGMFAAIEMQQRVQDIPPVSGVKLSIRIGVHFGPVEIVNNDAVGETADVTHALCDQARTGQVLATEKAFLTVSREQRPPAKPGEPIRAGAELLEIPVVNVLWGAEDDGSRIFSETIPFNPLPTRLRVRYREVDYFVSKEQTRLTFGRDKTASVMVHSPRASRHHARVEFRLNGLFLIDESTNGTVVTSMEGDSCVVHNGEMPLTGKGRLTFGQNWGEEGSEHAEFEVLP